MAAAHVAQFVCIFGNSATAHNYVGFIRWACAHLGVSTAWHSEILQATLKGAHHRAMRLTGGAQHAKHLLTQDQVQQIVVKADLMNMKDYACFILVCWEYLLRVQSEGLPLLAGVPDDATSLPSGRHSGVCVWTEMTHCASVYSSARIAHRARCCAAGVHVPRRVLVSVWSIV